MIDRLPATQALVVSPLHDSRFDDSRTHAHRQARVVLEAEASMRAQRWSEAFGLAPFAVAFTPARTSIDPPAAMAYLYGEPMIIEADPVVYAELDAPSRDALIARELAGVAGGGVAAAEAHPGLFDYWFRTSATWRALGVGVALDVAAVTAMTAVTIVGYAFGSPAGWWMLALAWGIAAVVAVARAHWATKQRQIVFRCDRLTAAVVGIDPMLGLLTKLTATNVAPPPPSLRSRLFNANVPTFERRVALDAWAELRQEPALGAEYSPRPVH